jgi:stage V sporulation protein D (sporulation-specific penicillin-binding protein)
MNFLKIRSRKRLLALYFIFAIVSIIFAVRLFFLQVFPDEKILEGQIDQLMGEIPITAPRGEIYDRNMVLLVKDATSYRVYARPNDIKDYEETAQVLSDTLDLDYDNTLKKISNTSVGIVLIKTKVDNDVAISIRDQLKSGITIEEDQKRYYTNGNFLSNVLGFTGYDHQGLFGIEAAFDDVLSGEDGVLVYEKDANGNKINSGTEIRKEAVAGDSIVLTIDSIIQHYVETEISNVLSETNAKKVIAIVSDVNTGEVLAMATNPDYDLNDPTEISDKFLASYGEDLYKTNEDGKKVKMSNSEIQMVMWSNPAVSFNYEPGSTFKLITTSATLEEGVMDMNTSLYCPGYVMVDGVKINCYIYPRAHGSNPLHTAVAKSCNPSLVKMIMTLGRDKFYEYVYNFGFGDTTGIALTGEESGIVPVNDDNMTNVDFATKSFGQGISVTPLQLVMALNAATNGGYLYKPLIAKEIIDTETGDDIYTYDSEVVRQVISNETSGNIRSIMKEMIDLSSSLTRLTKGYKIAGKTGTAQKAVNGKYAAGTYVASFYGVVPYDNPIISVLVLVDEPEGAVYGSQVAAPPGIEILKKVMNYYDYIYTDKNAEESKIIPDFRGENIDDAIEVLNTLGVKYTLKGDSKGIVTSQDPVNIEYKNASSVNVTLTVSETTSKAGKVKVPDLTNMSVQKANDILYDLGLKINIEGGGIVQSQSPEAGTSVETGSVVKVVCEYID